jgi:hypothetical protein
MSRSRLSRAWSLVASVAVTLVACSSTPEQPILNQFFTASRLRDTTSLANFTTVAFEPNAQGIIIRFDITNVGAEQRQPLELRTLAKARAEAEMADTDFSKRKFAYQNENMEAIKRVLKAERENGRLAGKDAEVQAMWSKLVEDETAISRKVVDAKRKLASEKAIVDMSVNGTGAGKATDVSKYDGDLVSKDVSISAPVKLPGGQTAHKNLILTMQRAVLKATPEITGRWIITSIRDASGSPSPPRS